ncbi:hypothetical protein BPC006_I0297 [Burkholderia pseudomallei BPC006]|nr:hypothetical protein BPC006_I0297 [Burkholderia pseudomallei BPC006]
MDVHAAPRLSHSVAPVTSARPLTSRRARRRRMRADARRRTGTHARRPIDDDRASTPHAKQLSSPPPAQLSNYVELFSGGFHSKDSFILTRAGAHIAHSSARARCRRIRRGRAHRRPCGALRRRPSSRRRQAPTSPPSTQPVRHARPRIARKRNRIRRIAGTPPPRAERPRASAT